MALVRKDLIGVLFLPDGTNLAAGERIPAGAEVPNEFIEGTPAEEDETPEGDEDLLGGGTKPAAKAAPRGGRNSAK